MQGALIQTYDALTLTLESSVELYGVIKTLPEGKTAPDNHELVVDYWTCVGKAPGGDDAIMNRVSENADPSILADNRHLVLRGETASAIVERLTGRSPDETALAKALDSVSFPH